MISMIQGDDYAHDLTVDEYPDMTDWTGRWAVVTLIDPTGLTLAEGNMALNATDPGIMELRISPTASSTIPVGKAWLVAEVTSPDGTINREILQVPIMVKPQGIPLPLAQETGASKKWDYIIDVAETPYTAEMANAVYILDTNIGVVDFTFPEARLNKLRTMYVENAGSSGNSAILIGMGTDKIEGSSAVELTDQMGQSFYSDGNNWRTFKG